MDRTLHEIDDALVRMRRLWSTAPRGPDMSSVLVVEACAREVAPSTVGDVARFAGVEHSTASRLVERAVVAGYVERTADGRRAALRLTGPGRELRERAVAFRTAWLADVLGSWSDADRAAFARLLGRFSAEMGERGPGTLLPPS